MQFRASFCWNCNFFFSLQLQGSRGHILTKERHQETPGTPRKSGFSDRKRPKEGERVARRHFHERVGESPRREKNFGTSGYKIRRFVPEIWPFEVGIAVRTNFTCKILVLFKCHLLDLIFKGLNSSDLVCLQHFDFPRSDRCFLPVGCWSDC